MAIDTAHKRFSIMLDPGEMGYPPSNGIDAADRAVMLEWYSGIDAAIPDVTGFYIGLVGSVNTLFYLPGSVEASRSLPGSVNTTVYLRGSSNG